MFCSLNKLTTFSRLLFYKNSNNMKIKFKNKIAVGVSIIWFTSINATIIRVPGDKATKPAGEQ